MAGGMRENEVRGGLGEQGGGRSSRAYWEFGYNVSD